eukprot:9494627-Pyramimonas_sp.AAC.1
MLPPCPPPHTAAGTTRRPQGQGKFGTFRPSSSPPAVYCNQLGPGRAPRCPISRGHALARPIALQAGARARQHPLTLAYRAADA